jgi:hypothetical protein
MAAGSMDFAMVEEKTAEDAEGAERKRVAVWDLISVSSASSVVYGNASCCGAGRWRW